MNLQLRTPTTSSNFRLGPARYLILLLIVVLTACGTDEPFPATQEDLPPGVGPAYNVFIVNTDLEVGTNRVVFGIADENVFPVRSDTARVQAVFVAADQNEEQGEVRHTSTARWQDWPPEGSGRGVFVTTINFDQAGEGSQADPAFWQLRVDATTAEGRRVQAQAVTGVRAQALSHGIGDPAPASVTPTVNDVTDLATITSATTPDPDLYRLSIHQALQEDKPLVVVFSTPAFCASATCGPQVEMLSQVKEKYSDRANFIHVEVFEDPHLIAGRNTGQPVPAFSEWRLIAEPWTFVVGRSGLVRAKFEQFTTAEEIEAALLEAF
ncbi:MAG: hypothetical protein ACE5Q6_07550 [Dehalococcoidia bacterium]